MKTKNSKANPQAQMAARCSALLGHVSEIPLILAGSCNLKDILPLCCRPNQALGELCVGNASVKGRSRCVEQLNTDAASLLRCELHYKPLVQIDAHETAARIESAKNLQRSVERCLSRRITGNICSAFGTAVEDVHARGVA